MCWGVSGRLLRSLPVTTQDDKTPAGPVAEPATEAKKSTGLPWIVETLLIVLAVLFVVGLFQQFVGRQYVIPSGSMEPTLHGCEGCSNDRIFTEKVSYYGSDPQPGDLVFFGSPSYHVGIYLGDGMMIDAPRTGSTISIRPVFDGVSGYGRV